MNAYTISVATAVASAAIAALGLLLNWYRREEGKEGRKRNWLFIATAVGIVILAMVGVTLTFVLGADTKSSTGSINRSDTPAQLTEAQYISQLGTICSDAKEEARRVDELGAQAAIGVAIKIEQDEVNQMKQLRPPDHLQGSHDNIAAVWQRRVSLLESIYQRLSELSGKDIETEASVADQLAQQLAESFKSMGLRECALTD